MNKEAAEQAVLFQWAAFDKRLKWMFHIPNGGSRNKIEAANLKKQGVKAGVSDIFVPIPNKKYHGLFIEMKAGRNKPTERQNQFIKDMSKNGYACAVCCGSDDAINCIKEYLKDGK